MTSWRQVSTFSRPRAGKGPCHHSGRPDGRHAGGPKRQKGRICFIWIGDLQYELIENEIDEVGLYANCLSNGGPLRFHHICFRVPDWADFRSRVDAQEFPVAMERGLSAEAEGGLKFLYLDAREVFGHYIEYTWMPEPMWQHIRAM
ncbi:VOC family protein [Novosphingobium panipatense]|uniref:VOC family protein n=1 Tax=Novosphingobium panipatense TaxID=428991 RepID=UPI00360CAA04